MTATSKSSEREESPPRHIHFSSLESLGFSDSDSTWSDSPTPRPTALQATNLPPWRGRHIAPEPEPDPLADWHPRDPGNRLSGGNLRWGLLIGVFLLIVATAGAGFWLYRQPAIEAQTSIDAVARARRAVDAQLGSLAAFNDNLGSVENGGDPADLFTLETTARELFSASAALPDSEAVARSAAATASRSVLDGIRLATDTSAYVRAVVPMLVVPELETDPEAIELDDAARSFGDWQLSFDEVRTALPDGVLPDATQQLDILSGDLAGILRRYVDALRGGDPAAAGAVLDDLSGRLDDVKTAVEASVESVKTRVNDRISETRQAISSMVD